MAMNIAVHEKKSEATVSKQHYLIITALGEQRKDTIYAILRALTQCGCNVLNTKTNVLGTDLAMTLCVAGNWGAIAKIETLLPSLEKRLGIKLYNRRSNEPITTVRSMSYNIQVTAMDSPGILLGLTEFLYQLAIPIEEITGHTYTTHTETPMVSITIKINVPESIHLASLREQFMMYCDEKNLDAFLEPIRG